MTLSRYWTSLSIISSDCYSLPGLWSLNRLGLIEITEGQEGKEMRKKAIEVVATCVRLPRPVWQRAKVRAMESRTTLTEFVSEAVQSVLSKLTTGAKAVGRDSVEGREQR